MSTAQNPSPERREEELERTIAELTAKNTGLAAERICRESTNNAR